jgi:hypothetical protein
VVKPIEFGLVLEGEDAKEFFRNEKMQRSSSGMRRILWFQRSW